MGGGYHGCVVEGQGCVGGGCVTVWACYKGWVLGGESGVGHGGYLRRIGLGHKAAVSSNQKPVPVGSSMLARPLARQYPDGLVEEMVQAKEMDREKLTGTQVVASRGVKPLQGVPQQENQGCLMPECLLWGLHLRGDTFSAELCPW